MVAGLALVGDRIRCDICRTVLLILACCGFCICDICRIQIPAYRYLVHPERASNRAIALTLCLQLLNHFSALADRAMHVSAESCISPVLRIFIAERFGGAVLDRLQHEPVCALPCRQGAAKNLPEPLRKFFGVFLLHFAFLFCCAVGTAASLGFTFGSAIGGEVSPIGRDFLRTWRRSDHARRDPQAIPHVSILDVVLGALSRRRDNS